MSNIYIAGPMSRHPGYNYAAFDEAQKWFEESNWRVFSPANMSRGLGDDGSRECDDQDWRLFMATDLNVIMHHCDAIALLPGWENSRGATVELALAQYLGLKVYDAVTMMRITPGSRPWAFKKHVEEGK